jgi:hypothetical protein
MSSVKKHRGHGSKSVTYKGPGKRLAEPGRPSRGAHASKAVHEMRALNHKAEYERAKKTRVHRSNYFSKP